MSDDRPAPGSLRFYLDYISSNAYLAWLRMPEIAARTGVTVEPVPVLFAGLLEAHGQLGPAEVLPKALWMARNNLRKAAMLGVPLNPPVHHPFNPLLALRVTALAEPASARDALVGALLRAVWVEARHVSEPAVVREVADAAGCDGAALVARAEEADSKRRLRELTDGAIAAGIFGVPCMQTETGEIFWGYDDLPYLEQHLAGNDPLDPEQFQRWVRPGTASAQRRRFRDGAE